MNSRKKLNEKRDRRDARTKAAILGNADRPRLTVFRSNKYFYAQLVDDMKGTTIVSASSTFGAKKAVKKVDDAFSVGEALGKKAVEKGITQVVFDRGAYKFHGRVKQFAEGAKKAGLTI